MSCLILKSSDIAIGEGSLKSNFRQYGHLEKQRWEGPESRRKEVRRSERRKRGKKEEARARKVGKLRFIAFFQWFCGSGGSKSRLAKAAGAEPSGQMRDEKLHAVVARSTLPSQKCQTLQIFEPFLTFRCRKSAH